MKAADLERVVAVMQGRGRVLTDSLQRMRELRNLGFIPVGGRGPNAPDVGPEHCANFLIAVGGTATAARAGWAVLTFAPLVPQGGHVWGDTLRAVLTHGFEDPKIGTRIKELRFRHEAGTAEMLWKNGADKYELTRFVRPDSDDERTEYLIGDETYISGRVIDEINSALHYNSGQALHAAREAAGRGAERTELGTIFHRTFKKRRQK